MTSHLPEDMIKAGEIMPVTVIGIAKTGIIVQVDNTEYTSFIHISKIAKGYVNDINDYVSKGDKLNAMGSTKGKKPELILSHLDLQPKEHTPKKQYTHAPVPQPVPEQFTPTQHIPMSLDDMLAEADRSYKAKFSNKDKKQRPRRRNFKKNSENF